MTLTVMFVLRLCFRFKMTFILTRRQISFYLTKILISDVYGQSTTTLVNLIVEVEVEKMVLSHDEIKKCLEILEIEYENVEQVTLRQASVTFQKLALLVHPDKAGEDFTPVFLGVE